MDDSGAHAERDAALASCRESAIADRAMRVADVSAAECLRSHWYPLPGLLPVRLPNFAWRRQALLRHDLHHVLTGYPHTPLGEMQMAAWEFAAGRFAHPGATAFCLPLVGMGAVLSPRRTRAAFVRGRRSTSLYATRLPDGELASRILEWRGQVASPGGAPASPGERRSYRLLVALSFAWMLAPCVAVALAIVVIAR